MADLSQLDFIQALGSALLHFLWQGAILGIAAAVLMRLSQTATIRYAVGVGTLIAMLAVPVATFFATLGHTPASLVPMPGDVIASTIAPATVTATGEGLTSGFATPYWPVAGVFVWLSGIVVLSVRLAGGWVVARRMARRSVRPAAAHIQAAAADLADRLGLRRAVEVLESSAVSVPVLVGWLRPVVVFPVAALAGLSPAQIEALLAHELAHVRRHDYLVNVLQSFAEIVLFYHPAVWWVSRRVRAERELCCDDVTVGVCDRLVYATALTDLAAMMSPRVALAATGGDLVGRVRRILGREESVMSGKYRWAAGAVVLLVLVAAVPVVLAQVKMKPMRAAGEYTSVNRIAGDEAARAAQSVERTEIEAAGAMLEQLEAEQTPREQALVRMRRTEAQARAAELDAARAELERVRKMFEVGLATRRQLMEAETALERIAAGSDVEKQREIEVAATKRLLEDTKQKVAVGLLPEDELARAEMELRKVQAGNDLDARMKVEAEAAQREVERARELMERGLLSERQLRDQEQRLVEVRRHLEQEKVKRDRELDRKVKDLIDKVQKDRIERDERVKKMVEDASQQRVELRRRAEAQQENRIEMLRRREAETLGRTVVRERVAEDTSNRAIVSGDFVLVTIEGETQLPTVYRIGEDGAIRVPLLGPFKVIGQTPSQVRDAIGKKLSDSRLGSASRVRVALRRR